MFVLLYSHTPLEASLNGVQDQTHRQQQKEPSTFVLWRTRRWRKLICRCRLLDQVLEHYHDWYQPQRQQEIADDVFLCCPALRVGLGKFDHPWLRSALLLERGLVLASSRASTWNATVGAEEGLARGTSPTELPRPLQATGRPFGPLLPGAWPVCRRTQQVVQ